MQFKEAADDLASPQQVRGAGWMLKRTRGGRAGFRARQQTLGRTLDLKEAGRAVAVTLINRGGEVRSFVRQALLSFVDLEADLKNAERLAVFQVFGDIAPQAR